MLTFTVQTTFKLFSGNFEELGAVGGGGAYPGVPRRVRIPNRSVPATHTNALVLGVFFLFFFFRRLLVSSKNVLFPFFVGTFA